MSDHVDELEFVKSLRALGVRSVRMDGARIAELEFFEGKTKSPADNMPTVPAGFGKDVGGPEVCHCGHLPWQHNEAGCVIGCASERCELPNAQTAQGTA